MDIFNIYEAKTHLSQLVDRAAAGEEIVIAKAGTPVARLMPVPPPSPLKRQLGLFRHEIRIGDDFDDPLPIEIMDASTASATIPNKVKLLLPTWLCGHGGNPKSSPVQRESKLKTWERNLGERRRRLGNRAQMRRRKT